MTVRVPLYERLPEVYRIEDAKQGLRRAAARLARAARADIQRRARERRGALPRPLHRDVRPVGDPLHRRPARHISPHGRSGDDPARRRRHDRLAAAQGHARCDRGDHRGAHRLGRPRRRAVQGPCVDAAPRPPAARRGRRTAVRRDDGRPAHGGAWRHGDAPRPVDARAARHAVRPVRARARLPRAGRGSAAPEPAEPRGVPVAPAAVPDRAGRPGPPRH